MQFKDLASQVKIKKIVFIPQRYVVLNGLRKPSLPPKFYEVLDYLGIPKSKILLLQTPKNFESLWVAKQQSYFRVDRPLTPEYREFLHSRALNCLGDLKEPTPTKVYISRSNYFLRGSYAGETYIEKVLQQNGFTIFYPEKHSLKHQLNVYFNAQELLFSEGTAIHVLELLGNINAKVGVIRRRQAGRIAIEPPLKNRVKNYSIFEENFPLPSLYVAPKRTTAASGSAVCFVDVGKISEYLASEFGVNNVDHDQLKQQSLEDLDTYYETYKKKISADARLIPILKHYEERYEAVIHNL